MKRMKNILLAAMMVAGVAGVALVPNAAYAAPKPCPNDSSNTYDKSPAECAIDKDHKNDNVLVTVKDVINVVLSVVGVVAVAVIVIAGIYFIISQGDAAKVTKARNTILYGVVGLIVALLAYAIVNFVLSNVFSGE